MLTAKSREKPKGKDSLRVVVFCGDRSRYGSSHVPALLATQARVEALVVPSAGRWAKFHAKATGQSTPTPSIGLRSRVAERFPVLHRLWRTLRQSRQARRGEAPGNVDVRRLAAEAAVPVFEVEDVNDEHVVVTIEGCAPDVCVSFAYPQIFRERLIRCPSNGFVNFHPSLLPRCRGRNPVFWAIASGEVVTGVTVHHIEPAIDAGGIVLQAREPIRPDDTYATLYARLTRISVGLVTELVALAKQGPLPSRPQMGEPSYFSESPEDRDIDWARTANDIRNLVRACSPSPGARAWLSRREIRILEAIPCDGPDHPTAAPGSVLAVKGDVLCVATGRGRLQIVKAIIDGASPAPARRLLSRFGPPGSLRFEGREVADARRGR